MKEQLSNIIKRITLRGEPLISLLHIISFVEKSEDVYHFDSKHDSFTIDLKRKQFIGGHTQNDFVFNFDLINNWDFFVGDNNIFILNTNCNVSCGFNCKIIANTQCSFYTKDNCSFKTDMLCNFKTGKNCFFNTGLISTFLTKENCLLVFTDFTSEHEKFPTFSLEKFNIFRQSDELLHFKNDASLLLNLHHDKLISIMIKNYIKNKNKYPFVNLIDGK